MSPEFLAGKIKRPLIDNINEMGSALEALTKNLKNTPKNQMKKGDNSRKATPKANATQIKDSRDLEIFS